MATWQMVGTCGKFEADVGNKLIIIIVNCKYHINKWMIKKYISEKLTNKKSFSCTLATKDSKT